MRVERIGTVLLLFVVGCGDDQDARDQPFDPNASMGGTADPTSGGTSGTSSTTSSTTGSTQTTSSSTSLSTTATSSQTSSGSSEESSTGESTGEFNDCPRAAVDVGEGQTLNVRPDPSTVNAPIASLAHGTIVDVLDEVVGEEIDGVDVWYEISTGAVEGFVHSPLAMCTLDEPPDIDPNGWYLPLQCGTSALVTQGNFGATSHQGTSSYAFDFGVGLGTPLVAIADGVVTHTFDETGPGDPCYDGGDQSCTGFANYVTLRHADGTKSVYMHLQQVNVQVGDTVSIGGVVGLSGSTGWSTGRHAHVMRMEDCGGSYCQSIETSFNDVSGNGVPQSGDTVTSGNCP